MHEHVGVFSGKSLRDYLKNIDRTIMSLTSEQKLLQLLQYLRSDSDKILCLYGLKGSGKLLLMQQAMWILNDADRTLFLDYTKAYNDDFDLDIYNLCHLIDKYDTCKYIFVNGITRIPHFINTASALLKYTDKKRIVLSGKDSLAFAFTERNELWNRQETIYMTNFSSPDDIDDNYINDAISDNIIHTLGNFDRGELLEELSDGEKYDCQTTIRAIFKVFDDSHDYQMTDDELVSLSVSKDKMDEIIIYLQEIAALPKHLVSR